MLRIRLSRTGKTNQESFRIVVAPHTNAVKRKYTELLGHYVPAAKDKAFDIQKDRVEYWISKGAKPSPTMAAILKKHGFADMDKYIPLRAKTQRAKKKDDGKTPAATAPEAKAATPAKPEIKAEPKEEAKAATKAATAPEAPAPEPKVEAKEEAPAATKAAPAPEAKPEPKVEAKPEPKVESKEEAPAA